jgi:hypothetical protein
MTCEEFRDNSAALALGALSPDEAIRARAHLESCDACAADYRASSAAVEQLPLGVPLVRAPEAMRAAVFAAVGAERGSRSDAPHVPPRRSVPTAIRAVPAGHSFKPANSVAGTVRRRRSRLMAGFHTPALAAAFAGLAIIGLAAWSAWLQMQVHDLRHHEAAVAAAPPYPGGSSSLAAEVNSLALISAPGTLRAQLVDRSASGPSGAVFWNPEQRRCVVIARQLAPPDPGQEYRVWVGTGGQSWDGGPVTPDSQGIAETVLPTDRWHIDSGYTVSIVLQSVPADGTRRTVLTGELQPTSQ